MTADDVDSNGCRDLVFAQDHLLRNWADKVRRVWAAIEPTEMGIEPQDLRTDEVHGAALALLNDFCFRVAFDEPQSRETLRWLAEALERMVEHKDPLQCFGLLPRANNRPADSELATEVTYWITCARKLGHDDAKALAAECFHKDVKTIERYLRETGEWAASMNPDLEHWKRRFLNHGRPLPTHAPTKQVRRSRRTK